MGYEGINPSVAHPTELRVPASQDIEQIAHGGVEYPTSKGKTHMESRGQEAIVFLQSSFNLV